MKPTTESKQFYSSLFDIVTWNADLARSLEIVDHDPFPEPDERGWRRVEGWGMVFEGAVRKEWTNFVGGLHGAAASFIVDTTTSAALIAIHTPTFWPPPLLGGLSLALDIEYFHPAKVGTKLRIKVKFLRCTTTLANIRCDVEDAASGRMLFSGKHLKAWKAGPEAEDPPSTSAKAKL